MKPDLIYDDIVIGSTLANPVYARRGTFDKADQHFYPTKKNSLPSDLEAPYAHSLSNGVRYWTRNDALADIRWNALARLPCLNCLASTKPFAARYCDRSWRQERSNGTIRCCSHCEEKGQGKSCVELIEVYTTHLFDELPSATTPKQPRVLKSLQRQSLIFPGVQDIGIWGRTAYQQRARGLAVWRPVNLYFGDVASKAKVVASYKARQGTSRLIPVVAPDPEPCRWRLKHARALVEVWDRIDAQLSKARPELASSIDDQSPTTASIPTITEVEIDDVPSWEHNEIQYWTQEVVFAFQALYRGKLETQGRLHANKLDDVWQENRILVITQIRSLFLIKHELVGSGVEKKEAARIALSRVDKIALGWMKQLAPRLVDSMAGE